MRLWFSRSPDVPLREQIVQQVRLGILSGELHPGERLPSTRLLARRYGMHANTVSAAFQQLAEEGWVHARQGSGMFVRAEGATSKSAHPASAPASPQDLEALLQQIVAVARREGITPASLQQRLGNAFAQAAAVPRTILVEPDRELARIVQHEIVAATGLHLAHLRMRPSDFATRLAPALNGATAAVLPSKAALAKAALGDTGRVITLAIQPVSGALQQQLPRGREHLVAIASHWPSFLQIAQTMLVSTGFHADSLLLRDSSQPGWRDGLDAAAAILCDSVTAAELPPGPRIVCFRLLAPDALKHFASATL